MATDRAMDLADTWSSLISRGHGVLRHGQYSITAEHNNVVLDRYTTDGGWVRVGVLTTNPDYYSGTFAGRMDVLASGLADAMSKLGAHGHISDLRALAKRQTQ